MRLASAAAYFDKVVCADAFDASRTFKAQLDVFDDSRRDGATVARRILSVAPAVAMPSRRVITVHGEQWLVGLQEADSFAGSRIRTKYVLHKAQGPCTVGTAAQALSSGGSSTYAAKIWVKDMKQLETASKLTSFYNIYLSPTEAAESGSVITLGGRAHVIRNSFLSAAGFLVAEGDELEAAALEAANLYARTYNPVTDAKSEGAAVPLNSLRMRFQDNYTYAAESAEKFVNGDIRALVLKSAATARVGDRLGLSDGSWYAVSVATEGNCWNLHLRRVPA